jgi:hypothetical protein
LLLVALEFFKFQKSRGAEALYLTVTGFQPIKEAVAISPRRWSPVFPKRRIDNQPFPAILPGQ